MNIITQEAEKKQAVVKLQRKTEKEQRAGSTE